MKGIFYGVGVGPGDPQLLTLKALKVLEEADIIAAPRTKGKNTLALDIVSQAISLENREILYLDFPMTRNEEERMLAKRDNLRLLLTVLASGKKVAMLSLGDASTFSQISYFIDAIKSEGHEVHIIAGVTSYSAAAATLQMSLTSRDLPLHIIPAAGMDLQKALSFPGTKVLMKPTLSTEALRCCLERAGVLQDTRLVENVTLPGERLVESMAEFSDETSYFTTLLVPAGEEGI